MAVRDITDEVSYLRNIKRVAEAYTRYVFQNGHLCDSSYEMYVQLCEALSEPYGEATGEAA